MADKETPTCDITRPQPVVFLSDVSSRTNQQHQSTSSLSGIRVALSRSRRCVSRLESPISGEVCAFLGVPYAEVPQRFARPQQLGRLWTGSRQATSFGAFCPQDMRLTNRFYSPFHMKSHEMDEDCLFLNVWTPTNNSTAKLPVMVWIYGGFFKIGASNYFDGTAYAALHNVVFVSFNYRVGAFGFLYTGSGESDVQGNMGLLDQREALRWVRRYIHCFGGDPDNVTLFGNSAGAASVCWHMVSAGSRGLFRRAIVQSGAIFKYSSALYPAQARRRLKCFLARKGVTNIDSSAELIRRLKSLPANQLIDDTGAVFLFMPVIDGTELLAHPIELVHRHDGNRLIANIDLMIGTCTNEGFVGAKASVLARLSAVDHAVLTREMAKEILTDDLLHSEFFGHPKFKAIVQSIWNEYFWTIDDNQHSEQVMQRLSEVYSDFQYTLPSIYIGALHAKGAEEDNHKTYMYQFNHRPSLSRLPDWVVATHGQEIPFVIGIPFLDRPSNDKWSDEDLLVCDRVMSMWSNFAKTGNPNDSGDDFHWPLYDVTNRCHAIVSRHSSIGRDFRLRRTEFWQTITEQLVFDSVNKQDKLIISNL